MRMRDSERTCVLRSVCGSALPRPGHKFGPLVMLLDSVGLEAESAQFGQSSITLRGPQLEHTCERSTRYCQGRDVRPYVLSVFAWFSWFASATAFVSMCVWVCVRVCVCMYVCVHVCERERACVHIRKYVSM